MCQKIVICSLLSLVLWVKPVVGQVDLKVRPIALAFLNLNAAAEVIKAPFWGFELAGTYQRLTQDNSLVNGIGFDEIFSNKLRVHATGKYYLNPRDGGDRLFVGVYTRYLYQTDRYTREVLGPTGGVEDEITNEQRQRLVPGLAAGYKFLTAKGFLIEVDGGIGRAIFDQTTSDNPALSLGNSTSPLFFEQFLLTDIYLRVSLGYRIGAYR